MKGFGKKDKKIKKKKHFLSKDKLVTNALNVHVKGEILQAKKLYESFIRKGFKDPKVFANYGAILQDNGNMKDAEIFARKAIEMEPNFFNAYSNLAKILESTQKFDEAENVYKKMTEIDPNSHIAFFNYGNILEINCKDKKAQESYQKAIKINPENEKLHLKLAVCLIKTDDLKQAEFHCKKVIEINRDNFDAHLQLGAILRGQLKFIESLRIFRELIKIVPKSHLVYFNLARTLYLMGENDEAELNLLNAIEIKKDCFDSYCLLSVVLRNQGKFEQSRICDEKMMSLRPWSILGSYNFNRTTK